MRFEIYESPVHERGFGNSLTCTGWEWRWRLRTANGRIMADGGEGYATKRGVRRAIHTICRVIIGRGSVPPIVEVES